MRTTRCTYGCASIAVIPRDRSGKCIWTDPGLEPDPAKWKTELIWPIK